MLTMLFLVPIADFKTVEAVARSDLTVGTKTLAAALGIALLLGILYLFLRLQLRSRLAPSPARPVAARNWILVDGSNVMHWLDNTPQLAPLIQVVLALKAQGYAPGVVFDANAGYKLMGKHMNDGEFARLLSLPRDQVLVVPKGTQADPFLLATARDVKARVVTNDRYRDWAGTHPEVTEPGFLIRGGMREGKVWLTGVGLDHSKGA